MDGGPPWKHGGPAWTRGSVGRRIGCAFAFIAIFVVGLTTVANWLLGALFGPGPGVGLLPVVAILALAIAAALVSGAVGRRLGRGVDDLVEAADRVAAGDYDVRVPVRGPREVRTLAVAFNEMAARLAAAEEQRRSLLADVTHELRTPLTVIQGDLEGLVDGIYPRDDEHLASLLEETRQLGRLIEDLRTLALAEAGALPLHPEATEPGGVVTDAVETHARAAGEAGIELRPDVAPGLPAVALDAGRIRQVLSNLIANALRFTPRGGEVVVAASRGRDGSVEFSVRDTGAGIEPADLERVFDRFQRSPESSGTGLGLAIARGIVEAHGGTIEARSEGPGRGAAFTFRLPVG